jgi:hypothetical protein
MKQDPGIMFVLGSVPNCQNLYFKRRNRCLLRFVTHMSWYVQREVCNITSGESKVAHVIRAYTE